jgi:hypothetical protein
MKNTQELPCNREHKHTDGETSTKLEVHID